MLIRIRYTDTTVAIEEVIDKLYSDKEVYELLHLLILSFFCIESDYLPMSVKPLPLGRGECQKYSSINRKIQNKLKLLDIQEGSLEDIYDVLYSETKTYLPQYVPHSNQHCIPLSCIRKTNSNTFTFHLEGLPIIPVLD